MSQKPNKITKFSYPALLDNNRLEKDIQKIANSFNLPSNILLTSKFNVRDSHIYPNGKKYQLLAFCFMLFWNALTFYMMFTSDYYIDMTHKRLIVVLMMYGSVMYYFSYILGFTMSFVMSLKNKDNIVSLILNIQTIHRSIGFSKISNYITWNWISLVTIFVLNIVITLAFCCLWQNFVDIKFSFDIVCEIMLSVCDIDLVMATRIMILLRHYLNEWIRDVLMMNDEQENEEFCFKMLQTYQNILKTYDLFKIVFRAVAMYHTVAIFHRTVFDAITVIQHLPFITFDFGNEALIQIMATVAWIAKNIGLILIHSFYCEKLYVTIEEAETACIQLMKNRDCPKSQTRLCKNVLHANRLFSKMSACGLFYMHGTLSIQLMGLVAKYVIVYLQIDLL